MRLADRRIFPLTIAHVQYIMGDAEQACRDIFMRWMEKERIRMRCELSCINLMSCIADLSTSFASCIADLTRART